MESEQQSLNSEECYFCKSLYDKEDMFEVDERLIDGPSCCYECATMRDYYKGEI